MKWTYETFPEYEKRMALWHKHFALIPVLFGGKGRWLCYVERRCIFKTDTFTWNTEYRDVARKEMKYNVRKSK